MLDRGVGGVPGGRMKSWVGGWIVAIAMAAVPTGGLADPGGAAPAAGKRLPFLHAEGTAMVDEAGRRMTLRGCNLGNWLVIESWMLGWDIEDQYTLVQVLTERFGQAEADRLMEAYRDGYVRPRDFDLIKSFGFNVVRVPFDHRRMIDEQGAMRPDAFKWLDRAVDMAEGAGVYAILDMHGPPGGQCTADHTGRRDQNKLWTDPVAQQRMVELWRNIAQRYKGRGAVAAYDLVNEPYGDFKTDLRADIRAISARCYEAVRSTGDSHVVIFPNALGKGVSFHGDLKAKGMTQYAFTDHYYAGLFGSPSTVASHVGMFDRAIPESADYLQSVGGPMLIGEFNVVLDKAGGKPMMRRYYDEFARRGWMATMWSYKLLKPAAGVQADNWYMVTNAGPLPKIDPRKSDKAEIEASIAGLAGMPLAVDEGLRDALTRPESPPIPMPALDPLPKSAPPARSTGAWTLADVDTRAAGGVEASGNDLAIVAAGGDIFGTRDSFGFLHQPAPRSAVLTASLAELLNSDVWAKAGLMVRFGRPGSTDFAAAPFVMINAFPDGTLSTTVRDAAGAPVRESKRVVGPLPRRLALVRDGDRVETYADTGGGAWLRLASAVIPGTDAAHIGLAVCSHHDKLLTRARFADVSLRPTAGLGGTVVDHANPASPGGTNLLQNGSFERQQASGDATGWNRWGSAVAVAAGDGPHGGSGALVHYDAAAAAKEGDAGLWQDVRVTPGKRYRFAIFAQSTGPAAVGPAVTLSLEATADGKQVALAERTCEAGHLETAGGWSLLDAGAVALSDRLRVLVRIDRGAAQPAGGAAIRLDDASLVEVKP